MINAALGQTSALFGRTFSSFGVRIESRHMPKQGLNIFVYNPLSFWVKLKLPADFLIKFETNVPQLDAAFAALEPSITK